MDMEMDLDVDVDVDADDAKVDLMDNWEAFDFSAGGKLPHLQIISDHDSDLFELYSSP